MFGPNNTPSADLRLDLPPEPEPSAGWKTSLYRVAQIVVALENLIVPGTTNCSSLVAELGGSGDREGIWEEKFHRRGLKMVFLH